MNHALSAQIAWSMATHRAFRIQTGIQMNEEVRRAAEVPAEDSLQFFDLPMALLQGKISRENQVEVNMDQPSGSPGPQPMHINP